LAEPAKKRSFPDFDLQFKRIMVYPRMLLAPDSGRLIGNPEGAPDSPATGRPQAVPSRFPHAIIFYSQTLRARRTVSINVLSGRMTVFERAKFA